MRAATDRSHDMLSHLRHETVGFDVGLALHWSEGCIHDREGEE